LDINTSERVKSDGSRRERKQVERFVPVATVAKKRKKPDLSAEGRGTKLGEIPFVAETINKTKAQELEKTYRCCFGVVGKKTEIKKALRIFSGFPFNEVSDEFEKRKATIQKFENPVLKNICRIFGISAGSKKEDAVNNVLQFCLKPEASGKKTKSEIKSRRSSTKSKGKGKKKSSSKSPTKKKISKQETESRGL